MKVLVREFLAVDGATTGALERMSTSKFVPLPSRQILYIATGEVTALEHELGDDTMKLGANVTLALLLGFAELLEILRGLGDDVVEEFEIDAAGLF